MSTATPGSASARPGPLGAIPMSPLAESLPAVQLTGDQVLDDEATAQREHLVDAINIMLTNPALTKSAATVMRQIWVSQWEKKLEQSQRFETWSESETFGVLFAPTNRAAITLRDST